MAKVEKTKKEAKVKTEKKVAKKEAPEFKYGVSDLATELDIAEASVRVQLRNKEIKKAGKSYGWNSETEFKAVVKQLSAKPEKAEKKSVAKKEATAKPAKKVEKKAA